MNYNKNIIVIANNATYHTAPRGIQANRLIDELAIYNNLSLISSNRSFPDNKTYFNNNINKIYIVKTQPVLISRILGKLWRFFKIVDYFWLHRTKTILNKILKNVDIIITLSVDLTNAELGKYCKMKYPSIKWISFFSDPISISPYLNGNVIKDFILRKYEQKLFNKSDLIIFPSLRLCEKYSELYPYLKNIMKYIPHNYKIDSANYLSDNSNKHNSFVVSYFGMINEQRNPIPLVNIIHENIDKLYGLNIKFEFTGNISNKLNKRLESLNSEYFSFNLPIPYFQVKEKILKSDALLVIDANIYPSLFLPSKLVEYLTYSKPIIGITPEESESDRILNKTNHYSINYNNLNNIFEIIKTIKNSNLKISKNIEEFDIKNVAKKWQSLIEQIGVLL